MSSAGRRYFCHKCTREVLLSDATLICPDCNDGFLEEIVSAASQLPSSLHRTSVRRSTRGSNASDRSHVSREHPHTNPSNAYDTTMTEMLINIEGDHMYSRPVSLDYMLQQLLENVVGPERFSLMNVIGEPMGQGEFDRIITQMLSRLDNGGPPPASPEELSALNTVKISQAEVESQATCSICFEDYVLQESVVKLPCVHLFHQECIVGWLRRHGTCPVCRKTLSGDDTTARSYDFRSTSAHSDTPSSSNETPHSRHTPDLFSVPRSAPSWRRQPRNERSRRGSPP